MGRSFAFNQDPVLGYSRMAAGAGPDHIRMADFRVAQIPTYRRVTIAAGIGSIHMHGPFTIHEHPILGASCMTIRTGPVDIRMADLRVIHIPAADRMAIGAIIRGVHMQRPLACCRYPVMAADTRAKNIIMVKYLGFPGNSRVAFLAMIRTRDVIAGLALGHNTVMTAEAFSYDIGMVDSYRGFETCGAVAGSAVIIRFNMISRLKKSFGKTTLDVAGSAVRRRILEYDVRVALLTPQAFMGAG